MVNLPPKFKLSHVYKAVNTISNGTTNRNTLELFLDYNCPFSAKLFRKINDEVIPVLKNRSILDKFDIAVINVIQPWHYINSGPQHEVALAVANEYPDQFWKFSRVLFDNIEDYYDTETYELSRKQIVGNLIELAKSNLKDVDEAKLWDWVKIVKNEDGESFTFKGSHKLACDGMVAEKDKTSTVIDRTENARSYFLSYFRFCQ